MKGYRTIAFNLIAAIVPVLQLTEIMAIVPPEYLDWYMVGVAVANVLLRAITTTPIGQSA